MFKGVQKKELVIAAALVIGATAVIGVWFAAGMAPVRGLKISPPDLAGTEQSLNQKPAALTLNQISSGSFMAVLGLNVSPTPIPETASATATATQTIAVATTSAAVIVEPRPLLANLEILGYRLRGIILEDGRSAAFVFVPAEKRVVLVRENASGTIKLLEAGLRSVKLQTPDGTGLLQLENAKQTPSNPTGAAITAINTGFTAPGPGQTPATPRAALTDNNAAKPEGRVEADSGPNAIAGNINQGQLKISQQRGKFSVEVREIPENLKGYELKTGDKIIGTGAGAFSRPEDIARKLGTAGEQAQSLIIQRNGRVMTIQAPPPPPNPKGNPANKPNGTAQSPDSAANSTTPPLENPATPVRTP
ncbi:MAG TPA: hypothetical protein PLM07_01180 [Candidatus Rifleibacterium sp.]|nr:hypothetical protein [Candidatus Rifleibacterium sp.]HPT44494.1 hypothetical protein [Candidatus Rifleibacterium sp.]